MKTSARNLRNQGKSFREISATLNIPLSTTHLWTKDILLSPVQQLNLTKRHLLAFASGRLKAQSQSHQQSIARQAQLKIEGEQLIGTLNQRELFLIGIALYWSEGFKKDNRLGFANSDPNMIRFFLKWLYVIGKVAPDDIRLRVGINQNHLDRTDEIQEYWAKIAQIPLSQFQKPFYQISKQNKTYPNRHSYFGVLRIRVNCHNDLFWNMLGMINGLARDQNLA